MLFEKQIQTILERKFEENGQPSPEALLYLNDNINKMRTKITEFFDSLQF